MDRWVDGGVNRKGLHSTPKHARLSGWHSMHVTAWWLDVRRSVHQALSTTSVVCGHPSTLHCIFPDLVPYTTSSTESVVYASFPRRWATRTQCCEFPQLCASAWTLAPSPFTSFLVELLLSEQVVVSNQMYTTSWEFYTHHVFRALWCAIEKHRTRICVDKQRMSHAPVSESSS